MGKVLPSWWESSLTEKAGLAFQQRTCAILKTTEKEESWFSQGDFGSETMWIMQTKVFQWAGRAYIWEGKITSIHYPQNQKKIMGCSTTLVKLAWCYFFLLTVSNLMTVTVNLPATVQGLGEKKICCDSPDICPLLEPQLQNSECWETGKIKGSVMLQPLWLFFPSSPALV